MIDRRRDRTLPLRSRKNNAEAMMDVSYDGVVLCRYKAQLRVKEMVILRREKKIQIHNNNIVD